MNVHVQAGSGRISTGTYPSSYGYFIGVDTTAGSPAGEVVGVTTASGSNPRIDALVGYIDLSVTASSGTPNNPNNMLVFKAVAGTPASSPVAPTNSAIQSSIGASNPFIILAYLAVGTSVTQVNNGNITDKRTMARPVIAADTPASPFRVRLSITATSVTSVSGSGPISLAGSWICLDPADYTIPGKTTYFRLYGIVERAVTSDVIEAQLYNPVTTTILAAISTDNNPSVGTSTTITSVTSSDLVLRSGEIAFPTSATLFYMRLWNKVSGTNIEYLRNSFVEIYWR